ncbi:type I-E CRISPR-associated protein Cse1/CasA [Nocardia sp. NPDC004068]|uniref:type I-E CRISPR-associated protein Cse1/CasA n=1 Tax=Nocardia sp. NPDC004068 TaxID=3364303 RepID=UPI003698E08C
MTCADTDFDLIEQPWIWVIDREGRAQELSLRETFAQASVLGALTGELPTQSFAILRVLLAIARRAVRDQPGKAVEVWEELWSDDSGERLRGMVDSYLKQHADRFRLFDSQVPFMQVAELRSSRDAVSSLDKLIADVPNGEKYFTTRAGAEVDRIDFAEAARWLVHAHAFDSSGIKTGAVGDGRVKNGKGYPIGVGWAGALGGVFLEGETLRETLLLNLVLLNENGEQFPESDRPVWEREPDGPEQRLTVRCPDTGEILTRPLGPADLCTWQSRRIRLVRNNSHVTGVVLCNGDALEPFNQHLIEPMTGWRYSEAQSKKAGTPRHYPTTHHPDRSLWRGLASLLGEIANPAPKEGRAIAPGVVEWARSLIDADVLDPTHPLRLHAIGMDYISNQSVVGEIVDDTVGFQAAMLASDPQLRVCALNAVRTAEDAVTALAGLAGNLALAAGGEPDGARSRARERGYFALDVPYRRWLADLTPHEKGYSAETSEWHTTVRAIVERLGADLVDAAGPAAWVGREVNNKYLDSGRAAIWFQARLREVLAAAHPRNPPQGGTPA